MHYDMEVRCRGLFHNRSVSSIHLEELTKAENPTAVWPICELNTCPAGLQAKTFTRKPPYPV